MKEQGRLSSYLFEIVKNLQEIKILNASRNVIRIYSKRTASINKKRVESGKIDVTAERVNTLIALVAQLVIFIICSICIVNNLMQLGTFVAAISYFNMAANYFSTLNGKIVDIGKQNAAIQRVVDILNEKEEDYRDHVRPIQIEEGKIEFIDVTFGYSDGNQILNGINLCIEAGSTVAIVGKSGMGKTTIANLLCNLYDVSSGGIYIDGINITEYNLHSLRCQVGIVHQEATLYEATLRYNLAFSNCRDNDGLLLEAIRKVALYDVFLNLPDGLDTRIGNDGHGLSGGQKQRLAIARILIKNPKILIFDEATSSLDSQNEAIIRNVMSDISKDRTLIIIAHRFSTIRNCDKIAILKDGMIQGYDTHEVLIKSNETYMDLFREQCIAGGEAV